MTEKSDFGRGLVVNLVKFAEHFGNRQLRDCYYLDSWLRKSESEREEPILDTTMRLVVNSYKNVYLKTANEISLGKGTPEQEASSHIIELWANGATDHLYDITVPKEWKRRKIAKTIKKLQDFGLHMGHGFDTKRIWTLEDVKTLRDLVEEICIAIDKNLNLNPDWGEW